MEKVEKLGVTIKDCSNFFCYWNNYDNIPFDSTKIEYHPNLKYVVLDENRKLIGCIYSSNKVSSDFLQEKKTNFNLLIIPNDDILRDHGALVQLTNGIDNYAYHFNNQYVLRIKDYQKFFNEFCLKYLKPNTIYSREYFDELIKTFLQEYFISLLSNEYKDKDVTMLPRYPETSIQCTHALNMELEKFGLKASFLLTDVTKTPIK